MSYQICSATADRSHGDPPFGLQRATRAAAEEGLVEPTDNALAREQKEAPGIRVVPSWVVMVLGGRAKTASAAMRAGGKALWPGEQEEEGKRWPEREGPACRGSEQWRC